MNKEITDINTFIEDYFPNLSKNNNCNKETKMNLQACIEQLSYEFVNEIDEIIKK